MPTNTRVMMLPSPPSSGSIGSVTKSIGIARMLIKRGCEVCFVMGDKLGEFISRSGFKVYLYPTPVPNGSISVINSTVDFVEWTGMADEDFVQASIIAELEAIRDFKPDVIFAEARPSAAISAQIAGIPSVMIASWPCNPEHPANKSQTGRLVKVFNKYLKQYKLLEIENVIELFYMRSNIKLAPTLPELEPEMQGIEGINFVGYILDLDFNESQLPSWYRNWVEFPQVFIYLSVGALSPELYVDTITETFKDLPFRVICGCGFHYNLKSLPESLPNIKFERYVPTAAIMKDTKLAIFHGGQDTMLTTLLYGLPSITIPGQHFERDYNSIKLADTGASKKLPIQAFRPNRLRSVVEEVINGPYAMKSKQLSERLKCFGGTEQCTNILVNAVQNC
ncbi:MAG TPA: nucleotide disphospho-sugar-binding domain-containing protein [Pseudobacteroides sp.]|uniref:nucleotide disphospho-sugar-binding domain-containing protein n=1 Tax=Pseudobacteroides sp. TaxID=1968840 RepID=UPI002F945951